MEDKKNNLWKIATIVLSIALILVLAIRFYNNSEVIVSDVPIKRSNLNAISDLVSESKKAVICDYETNKCFMVSGIS